MNKLKETIKKRWWVGLIALLIIGKLLPSSSSNADSKYRSSSSVGNNKNYYKWACKYCGK